MSVFKRDRDPFQSPSVSTAAKQPPEPATEPAAKEPAATVTRSAAPAAAQHAAQPAAPSVKREMAAVIDKNSEIKGTLRSQGDVLIEGCFQGEIEAKSTVWVDKGAQTQAQLHANDVIVSGSFNGEIVCLHRLQITSTASIEGEIKTPVLVIEDGATINCRFNMTRPRSK